MYVAIDITETVAYSLKGDVSEPKSVFHLGLYDSLVRAHILSIQRTRGREDIGLRECVRHGLKGWENVANKHNAPVQFDVVDVFIPEIGQTRKVASDKCLDCLSNEAIGELADKLVQMNYQTEADKKKS